MSEVKNEASGNEMHSQTTIAIKTEPGELQIDSNPFSQEIKMESEIIIKSEFEWSPTKVQDEQQEYYLAYQCNKVEHEDEYKPSALQSDGNEHEEFSITYINENEGENNENYEDGDGDYDNTCNDEDYTEDNTSDEDSDGETDSEDTYGPSKNKNYKKSENSATTGTFSQRKFLNWLCAKYITYLCPICDKVFNSQPSVYLHMNQQHKDSIDKEKSSNYYFTNQTSQFICKHCNKHLHKSASLIVHSLRHSKPEDPLKLFKCNICQENLPTIIDTNKHIIEKHPDTKKTFESLHIKSKNETYECPLCPAIYNEFNHMRFHFIDKHPNEYGELFSYPCHLCENTDRNFNNDQDFFKHLLEEHNLKDWSLMNFDFYPKKSDDGHFICTKCFKIFTEIDLMEFLRHYLEHINYYRLCRCCNKKYSLKLINFYHMCRGWFKKFQTRAAKINKEQTAMSSWQQFEEYITHTCPFCNEEFETMQNWQIHLRELHQLDTLKGLEMEEIPNDSGRLKCNICNTFVVNSSVQLHTHRFQHLPYKPYTCRHCSRTFDDYKTSLNHFSKKCQDQVNQIPPITFQESHEISCPLCDNLKFLNKSSISGHFTDTHNNFLVYFTKQLDNSMKCNVCQLQLAKDDKKCRNHMLLHFARKSYKCLKCLQSFLSKSACYLHVRFHFAKANNTQEKSKNKSISRSNEQELNDTNNTFEKCTTLKEFVEFISYACPECNESLENKQLWQEHIDEKHDFFQEDNVAIKDPIDGILKCKNCQLNLGNWSAVQRQRHKLLHMTYKAFICKLCYFRGSSLGKLYSHFRSIHFAKGSHKCPICPVILTTPYEKTEHLRNTHPRSEWPDTEEQQLNDSNAENALVATKKAGLQQEFAEFIKYACPECNESLANHQLWQEHINEKHDFFQDHNLGVKDPLDGVLKCPNCRIRVASNLSERQKHKLTHMPYKGFLCKLCSYRGNTSALLITHLKATHFVKGSYECPICRAILTTPHEKSKHLENTHPRSEWPELMCRVCCMTLSSNSNLKTHMRKHEKSQTEIKKEKSTKRNLGANSPNTRKKIKMETE